MLPLASLCDLVAYVVDAQRVLKAFDDRASIDPTFDAALTEVCEDYLNPDNSGTLASAMMEIQRYIAMEVRELVARVEQ